jgi:predicted Zn-dependent protease
MRRSCSDSPVIASQLDRVFGSDNGSVKHVAMENRLYPLRELYAELLLETGQPAAALHEFETAIEQTPNRYRVLLGIARAANAAGDRQKGIRVLRQAREPGQERGYGAARNRGSQGLPRQQVK